MYVPGVSPRAWLTLFATASGCLAAFTGAAQPAFANRHLDAADGLDPDRYVMTFGWDARGFDYLGTLEGPFRFDGQGLTRLATPGPDSAQFLVHSDLHADRRGDIWYSTPDALVRLDADGERGGRVRPSALVDSGATAWHLVGYEAEGDELLVATDGWLWRVAADASGEARPLVANRSIRFLRVGPDRWLGFPWLLDRGIDVLDLPATRVATRRPTGDSLLARRTVSGGAVDHLGGIWLASDVGLLGYDLARDRARLPREEAGAPPGQVYQVARVDTLLYVATEGSGVWAFDPARERFLGPVAVRAGDPPCAQTRWLRANAAGVLFVTCAEGGVDALRPLAARVHAVRTGKGEVVRDPVEVHVARDSVLWVRTAAGRVARRDVDGAWRWWPAPPSREAAATEEMRVVAFAEGSGDTLWHARGPQLYALSARRTSPPSVVHRFATDILGVFASPTGAPWVLTAEGFQRAGGGRPLPGWQPAYPNLVYARVLAGDTVVLTDRGDALSVLRLATDTVEALDRIALPATAIGLSATASGLLVGTVDGLYVYRRDPQRGRLRLADHFLGGQSVVETAAAGAQRVVGLTGDALHVIAAPGVRTVGVPEGVRLTGDLLARDPTGAELLVHEGGVLASLRVDMPGDLAGTADDRAAVYFAGAWIDGRRLDLPERQARTGIEVPPGRKSLALAFATVGNYDLEAPALEYRVGDAGAWSPVGPDGVVTLASLAPGDFAVEARARSRGGSVTEPLVVAVAVLAPWYQRPGALAAGGVALAALVAGASYLVYRRRLVREREAYARELLVREERERIARELHDELGSELASILFLTEDAGSRVTEDEQRRIAEMSRASIVSMRDIVWMLDGSDTTLGALARQLSATARRLCADREASCTVEVAPEVLASARDLGFAAQRNLFLIVKEAVHNALRHARADELRLGIRQGDAGELMLEVADAGRGFDPAAVTRRSGLHNMRRRAEELGARFELHTRPGAGTRVRVRYEPPSPAPAADP